MAEIIQSPEFVRIRNKYPAVKNTSNWPEIKRLANRGDFDGAEKLAKATLDKSQKLRIRNMTAVRHRVLRRDYFRDQKDLEKLIAADLSNMGENISKMLLGAADSTGAIPQHKSKPITTRMKDMNTEAYASIGKSISKGVRDAVRAGMVISMDSAQAGLDQSIQSQKESDLVLGVAFDILEAEKKATILKTSTLFTTIFDRVKKRQIKKGLFGGRVKGFFMRGDKLSRTIWNLRNGNLERMRGIVSSGIASGRSAIGMANSIKSMVIPAKLVKSRVPSFGRGVYKSAYKNALRVTRSETNRAYFDSQIEYAKHKGYKKMWSVSFGHRKFDICDPLDGKIFDPEDVPPPQHSACACFLTTVIPGIS